MLLENIWLLALIKYYEHGTTFSHLMCCLVFMIFHHEIICSAQFSLSIFCNLLYCSCQPLGEVIAESSDKINHPSEFVEQDNSDGEDEEEEEDESLLTVKEKLSRIFITSFDQVGPTPLSLLDYQSHKPTLKINFTSTNIGHLGVPPNSLCFESLYFGQHRI